MGEIFRWLTWKRIQGLVCARRAFVRRANSTSAYTVTRQLKESPYMATRSNVVAAQNFDYFLVLDFEATCDNRRQLIPQEIIEFPVLKVNGRTFEIERQFHQYVQPDVHKELTDFCTELTGIIQDQVGNQPNLQQTLELFDKWMQDEGLLNPDIRSAVVTCGDWDLQTMLPQQCKYLQIQPASYLKRWINIKKPFCDITGTHPKGMMSMLKMLKLSHIGRHHSGIDDCHNIAAVLRALAERQYVFKITKELHH